MESEFILTSKGKIKSTRLLPVGSNSRSCITQDSEPNTLPTELFRPLSGITGSLHYLAIYLVLHGASTTRSSTRFYMVPPLSGHLPGFTWCLHYQNIHLVSHVASTTRTFTWFYMLPPLPKHSPGFTCCLNYQDIHLVLHVASTTKTFTWFHMVP